MGQSNVLLRIYYVKDFPTAYTAARNKKRLFYGARKKNCHGGRKKKRVKKKIDGTLSYQVVGKQ